jgi:hypothetical protein
MRLKPFKYFKLNESLVESPTFDVIEKKRLKLDKFVLDILNPYIEMDYTIEPKVVDYVDDKKNQIHLIQEYVITGNFDITGELPNKPFVSLISNLEKKLGESSVVITSGGLEKGKSFFVGLRYVWSLHSNEIDAADISFVDGQILRKSSSVMDNSIAIGIMYGILPLDNNYLAIRANVVNDDKAKFIFTTDGKNEVGAIDVDKEELYKVCFDKKVSDFILNHNLGVFLATARIDSESYINKYIIYLLDKHFHLGVDGIIFYQGLDAPTRTKINNYIKSAYTEELNKYLEAVKESIRTSLKGEVDSILKKTNIFIADVPHVNDRAIIPFDSTSVCNYLAKKYDVEISGDKTYLDILKSNVKSLEWFDTKTFKEVSWAVSIENYLPKNNSGILSLLSKYLDMPILESARNNNFEINKTKLITFLNNRLEPLIEDGFEIEYSDVKGRYYDNKISNALRMTIKPDKTDKPSGTHTELLQRTLKALVTKGVKLNSSFSDSEDWTRYGIEDGNPVYIWKSSGIETHSNRQRIDIDFFLSFGDMNAKVFSEKFEIDDESIQIDESKNILTVSVNKKKFYDLFGRSNAVDKPYDFILGGKSFAYCIDSMYTKISIHDIPKVILDGIRNIIWENYDWEGLSPTDMDKLDINIAIAKSLNFDNYHTGYDVYDYLGDKYKEYVDEVIKTGLHIEKMSEDPSNKDNMLVQMFIPKIYTDMLTYEDDIKQNADRAYPDNSMLVAFGVLIRKQQFFRIKITEEMIFQDKVIDLDELEKIIRAHINEN